MSIKSISTTKLVEGGLGRSGSGGKTPFSPMLGVSGGGLGHKAESADVGLDWANAACELVDENQEVCVLRVPDSSMQDALVDEGNLVVIKAERSAKDGEMIAAWLKPAGEITLKYYHRENGHVRLQPANPNLPPLKVRPSEFEILGQVLAIVRAT